jgi:hypothetical protein
MTIATTDKPSGQRLTAKTEMKDAGKKMLLNLLEAVTPWAVAEPHHRPKADTEPYGLTEGETG